MTGWPGPAEIVFAGGTVEIVWLRIAIDEEPSDDDLTVLQMEELERLARFRRVEDRARFAAVRAGLRRLLGERLGTDPVALAIAPDAFGKPRLAGDPLHFNVAHSGAAGIVALSRDGQVGVDVEMSRGFDDLDGLAARVLSSQEQAWMRTREPSARAAALIRIWALKEATMKARGLGLRVAPDSVSVIGPDGLVAVGGAPGSTFDPAELELRELAAPTGYAAAVALAR